MTTKFAELYYEAQRETAMAVAAGMRAREERRRAWGQRALSAQAVLAARLKESIPGLVHAAAAGGERSATLLDFKGTDTFAFASSAETVDDEAAFCYLFLLKGPHRANPEQCEDFAAVGGVPLLPFLRREVHPFALRHVWDRSTNDNALVIEW
jgi:hypothetical protein